MDDYLQKKRERSVTASPVGNSRLPSTTATSGTKPRLKQPYNNFVTMPTTVQASYSSQPNVQFHHQQHAGLTPEGETMERKVKEALMTELTAKPKPNGRNDPPAKSRADSSRLHPKNTHIPQQGASHQGYRMSSSSTSTWPGEDFLSSSNQSGEMTAELTNMPSNSRPDISEFDPIETKNK